MVRKRKNAAKPTQPGLVFQKVEPFPVPRKNSAKNRAGGAKLPAWEFGKPTCCTMVQKHLHTLKTPTVLYVSMDVMRQGKRSASVSTAPGIARGLCFSQIFHQSRTNQFMQILAPYPICRRPSGQSVSRRLQGSSIRFRGAPGGAQLAAASFF